MRVKYFQLTVRVNPNSSSSQSLHNIIDFVDVLRENSSCESIFATVSTLDNFIKLLESNDLLDWSENFFFSDCHVVSDIRKDSWLNKETFAVWTTSSSNQLCSLFLATFDKIQDLLLF